MKNKILRKIAIILAKLLLKVYSLYFKGEVSFLNEDSGATALHIWVFKKHKQLSVLNDKSEYCNIDFK